MMGKFNLQTARIKENNHNLNPASGRVTISQPLSGPCCVESTTSGMRTAVPFANLFISTYNE